MPDRQWFAEGVQVFETGEEEYFVEGVQVNEDQPDAGGGATVPALDEGMFRGGLQLMSGGLT